MEENTIDHQIAVDMVHLNNPLDTKKKVHGLMITLQKFSMNNEALAYVLLTPSVAEEVGMNLIRLAFLSRMNDGDVPGGMDVKEI